MVAIGGMNTGVGQGGELLHPFGKRQVVVTGGNDGHRLPDAAKPCAYRPAGQRIEQRPIGLLFVAAHEAQPKSVAHLGEIGPREELAPQPPGEGAHAKPAQPLEALGVTLLLLGGLQQKLAKAVDQHQTPHLVRQLQGQLQRHHGPQRQSHHPGRLRLFIKPVHHVGRQSRHVERPLLHALAVAAQVQRHHPVVFGKTLYLRLPVEAGRAKPVQQQQQRAFPRTAQGKTVGFHYLIATHQFIASRLIA